MKFLWVFFLVGVIVSTLLMLEIGQSFLIGLTLLGRYFIPFGILLAAVLSHVPMVTVWLGIFLAIHTVLLIVPGLSRTGRVGLFVLAVALTVGGLMSFPIWSNTRVDQALALAVAEDVPLSDAIATGSVVGLDGRTGACGHTCAELVMAAPGVRFVYGRFGEAADGASAAVPPGSETWALAPGGIGQCPQPPGNTSPALRNALAEAELGGSCLTRVAMAERVDLLIRRKELPKGGPGQTSSDQRTEMFLREGDNLRAAYRRTTGAREKLASPLRFYLPVSGPHGFGIEIRPGPVSFDVPLRSPAPDASYSELLKAALPRDFNILDAESFKALSQEQRSAAMQREKELIEVLHRARREAALAALQSDDAEEIARGITIADRYLRRFRRSGRPGTSDLPLLVALVSAPGGPGRWSDEVLRNAPPEVLLPVADSVRDRLIAIGDGPLDRTSRARYERILELAEKQSSGE